MVRIVGDQNGLISVPAGEIEAIQRVVETRLTAEPWSFLHPGHPVRIEVGPLRGIEGVVLNVKKRHRLIISVPLLQRSIAVEMEAEWLSVPLSVRLDATS